MGGLAALGAAGAACGSGGGGTGAAGSTELQFMYWGSTFEKAAIEKMLKAFEQKNPDIKVKPVFTPDEYDVKLNSLVAGGRTPDVGYVPMSMSFRLAEQGNLVNLHPYLQKYPQLAGTSRTPTSGTARTSCTASPPPTRSSCCGTASPPSPPPASPRHPPWPPPPGPGTSSCENALQAHRGPERQRTHDESASTPRQVLPVRLSSISLTTPRRLVRLPARATAPTRRRGGQDSACWTPRVRQVFQTCRGLVYKTPRRRGPAPARR
ncbi:hypothetical protein GCM10020220_017090 [Nonomuraea rubra]